MMLFGWLAVDQAQGFGIALGAAGLAAIVSPSLEKRLPNRRRQVSASTFFRFRPSGAAIRWGARLGFGVTTYFVSPGFFCILGLSLLQPSAWYAVVIGLWYGVARTATIAIISLADARMMRRGLESYSGGGRLKKTLRVPLGAAASLGLIATVVGILG